MSNDGWKIAIFLVIMCAGFIFSFALFEHVFLFIDSMPDWLYDLGDWSGTWICALRGILRGVVPQERPCRLEYGYLSWRGDQYHNGHTMDSFTSSILDGGSEMK
jgi:hypothetical protein